MSLSRRRFTQEFKLSAVERLEQGTSAAEVSRAYEVNPNLLHHSDRGVQYAANGYVDLWKQHEVTISMSRKANPYDNAKAESFIKTLKYEEVYRSEYRDLAEARASIGGFLEKVYNEKRLHSALGYCPPAEFEQNLLAPPADSAAVAGGVF